MTVVLRQRLTSLKLGEGFLGFARHHCDHQDLGKRMEKNGGFVDKGTGAEWGMLQLVGPFYSRWVDRPYRMR
jgi:hypothetical protein